MRVRSYVYDSADADSHVEAVLDLLERREERVDCVDVAAADDRADGRREAMLTVKSAVRIGSPPETLFDEDGRPDFSAGAVISEEPTGRRSLHVGTEAIEALRDEQR